MGKDAPQQRKKAGWKFAWLRGLVDDGILATLGVQELRVLMALYRYADQDGVARPSIPTLATAAGLDRRHLQRTLDRLVEANLLIRRRGGGRGNANRYEFERGGHTRPLFAEIGGTERHRLRRQTVAPHATDSPEKPWHPMPPIKKETAAVDATLTPLKGWHPAHKTVARGATRRGLEDVNTTSSAQVTNQRLDEDAARTAPPAAAVIALLTGAGLSAGAAAELAGEAERVGCSIERLRLLVATVQHRAKVRRPVASVKGFLFAAVRDGWEPDAEVLTAERERAAREEARARKRARQDWLASRALVFFQGLPAGRVVELRAAAASKLATFNYAKCGGRHAEEVVAEADLCRDALPALLAVRSLTASGNGPLTRAERSAIIDAFGGELY